MVYQQFEVLCEFQSRLQCIGCPYHCMWSGSNCERRPGILLKDPINPICLIGNGSVNSLRSLVRCGCIIVLTFLHLVLPIATKTQSILNLIWIQEKIINLEALS